MAQPSSQAPPPRCASKHRRHGAEPAQATVLARAHNGRRVVFVCVRGIALRLGLCCFGLAACAKTSTRKVDAATDLGPVTRAPDAEEERSDETEAAEDLGSDEAWNPWSSCDNTTSNLAFEAKGRAMSHEDDTSRTKVRLRTQDGKEYTHELGGSVGCLAYSRAKHAYVLGAVGAMAAWRPLLDILYLNDGDGSLVPSQALPDDERKGTWCAFTASASPDGRFIVFVSNYDSQDRLDVLDTQSDCLLRVGRPPPPPPSTWAQENISQRAAFVWGEAEAATDGFIGMDPGILVWREHILEASYGKDNPSKRAKVRTIKRWRMDKLVARCPLR